MPEHSGEYRIFIRPPVRKNPEGIAVPRPKLATNSARASKKAVPDSGDGRIFYVTVSR
jgi:hypothetical protein